MSTGCREKTRAPWRNSCRQRENMRDSSWGAYLNPEPLCLPLHHCATQSGAMGCYLLKYRYYNKCSIWQPWTLQPKYKNNERFICIRTDDFLLHFSKRKMLIGFSKTLYLFRLCRVMGCLTTVKAMPSVRTNLLSSVGQNHQDPFSVLPSELSSLLFVSSTWDEKEGWM